MLLPGLFVLWFIIVEQLSVNVCSFFIPLWDAASFFIAFKSSGWVVVAGWSCRLLE